MFKRILVPLDSSQRSLQALNIVKLLNRTEPVELILLEIEQDKMYPLVGSSGNESPLTPVFLPNDMHEPPPRRIHLIGESLRAVINHTITLSASGNPAETILEIAREEKADLIVMVSHGYGGLKRLLLGSVTEQVMRQAPCPVLALKSSRIPSHFLIGLDGTSDAEAILAPAAELAQRLDAHLTLLHVAPQPVDLPLAEPVGGHQPRPTAIDTVSSYLTGVATHLQTHYGLEVGALAAYGDPEEVMLDSAEKLGCNLYAMATHGRRGTSRFLVGSVTEAIFRRTDHPLLVVHRRE